MVALLAQQETAVGAVLFYFLAVVAAGSGLGVVFSRNIVRTAVALLFTLSSIAGLYLLLSAEFLAALQLVVYVGGTLILIVFGVMLTSKSPYSRFTPKAREVVIASAVGLLLLVAIVAGIVHAASSGLFADKPLEIGELYPVARLGQALLGDYLVPFEVASVLLLVVMIGAAYLAKGRRRNNP